MKNYQSTRSNLGWLLIASILLISSAAVAGSHCAKKTINIPVLARASAHALYLKSLLDNLHPQVALVARVGSDMAKYHLYYTHVGFVVYDYPGHQGQWTVVQLLNQCGTDQSAIYAQGLVNFFMDDLYNMDFNIIVPKATLQQQLFAILTSQQKLQLHQPHYSMIAYPFATRYQNSNQWVLEVLAAAHAQVSSREAAQQVLKNTHYSPSTITISTLAKLGASLFEANVKFDDHSAQERNSNRYKVVTVDSVVAYLRQLNQIQQEKTN